VAKQLLRLQPQAFADGDGHRLGRMVEGQFQTGKTDHGAAHSRKSPEMLFPEAVARPIVLRTF